MTNTRYAGGKVKRKAHNTARVNGEVRRNATTTKGRSSSSLDLTADERAMLPDPEWVTEDDADAILGMRSMAKGGGSPAREVLKRLGFPVDRHHSSRR